MLDFYSKYFAPFLASSLLFVTTGPASWMWQLRVACGAATLAYSFGMLLRPGWLQPTIWVAVMVHPGGRAALLTCIGLLSALDPVVGVCLATAYCVSLADVQTHLRPTQYQWVPERTSVL